MRILTFLFSCLVFWFFEAPIGLIKYFASFNTAFLRLFSLPILVRTFFKPLKNEYRQGDVEIAIALGVIIKSFIIAVDLILFIILLIIEISVLAVFLVWPIATVKLLFM